ncbi:dTMP kinase [Halonatronum saccharophilum]|uniref:dTMP kinase n=1 Tax=Halonatronum saccharophilum TaxID=150060 RepID=UPI0004B71D8B|nr:dTMP kinase [Halonatronum saccharophilum]
MNGYFISIEGVEGSGKSTQVKLIKDYLVELGYDVLLTYEPGDTKIGSQIRRILLNREYKTMVPKTELLLYAADRAQHVKEVIEPALEKGRVVISDRYTDATLAYQGYGRGLNLDLIGNLNQIATGGLKPDLTLLLDVDPTLSLSRAKAVTAQFSNKGDRIEEEKLSFHNRVREGYLDIYRKEDHIELIEAKGTIEGIFKDIKSILKERLII